MPSLLDPEVYIPTFLKIRTKDAELVPFRPKKAQLKLLKTVRELKDQRRPVRVIILKARQLGMSTMVEGIIFNDETTNQFKNGMILAHEDNAAWNLYSMYRTFFENIPPELTPMTKYSNKKEMLFENPTNDIDVKRLNPGLQSYISIQSAENTDAGRSKTIHNLHASEAAFYRDAKTLMLGLLQCVPDSPNSMVFIESTANGVGGWFYDMWHDAEEGKNDFVPLFFAWYEDPEYVRDFITNEECEKFIETMSEEEISIKETYSLTDEQLNWRRWTIFNKCGGDEDLFKQEYPICPEEAFIVSGRPVFNVAALRQYDAQCERGKVGNLLVKNENIEFFEDKNGYIEIWQEPQKNEFYIIGADVAEGLINGDFSDAVVYNSKYEHVATWHGHIDPDLYGKELVKLAKFYNEAYIGVENNNHGLTTLKFIVQEEYFNIYFATVYDKVTDTTTKKMGWSTNRKTKPMMIDRLAEYIREKYIFTKSKHFIKQCYAYVRDDKGGTDASEGEHDDLIMATAIAIQLLIEQHYHITPAERTEKFEENEIDTGSRLRNLIARTHLQDIEEDEEFKNEVAR